MTYFGNAWYPEHWPESRWPVDLQLMVDAGMNVVRIGEYAWNSLEPADGKFDTAWLERAVDLAAKFGLKVVMCTPTDAPPAWLTQKYPEVLRVTENGQPQLHGQRRHFSPQSPKYRELSNRIVSVMTQRFGHHPNVIGWQIGNEFCMYSYDKLTHQLFQQWLTRRYKTLENLNQRWTTNYWSQAYSDFSQIPVPSGWTHPSLQLDYFHFISEGFAEYQRLQMDIIRAGADKRQWITHNMHGWEDLDFALIINDADVAGWDPYPGGDKIDFKQFGFYSDFCRTLKPRPHWILETQPGQVNWAPPNPSLPRGAVRDLLWHFYGHGAEAVLFWQWRAPLGGHEQMHGTVIGPDGNPRPIYKEIAQVGKELRDLAPVLDGKHTEASVAVLYSYTDQNAIKHQKHHPDFDGLKHLGAFYGPMRAMPLDVDILDSRRPVEGYRLVVAPHLFCLDDQLVQKLVRYVNEGGHLLLGPRTGFKDEFNAMLPSRQPGRELADLLGAHVEEFCTLTSSVEITGDVGHGHAKIWAEYFTTTAPDVEVLLRYGAYNGWIDNQPGMVTRAVGKGRITYLGAWLEPELMQKVMDWAVKISGVSPTFPRPPQEVEVCRRVGNGKEIFIVINHSATAQAVVLPRAMKDLLGDRVAGDSLYLPPYDVAVLADA